jgi:hypothetical protein
MRGERVPPCLYVAPVRPGRAWQRQRARGVAVVFWLGYAIWWGHPGAELGCFFAFLAVVCTWGGKPASGVVGGGPWVTRRCPRRSGADLFPWPGRGGRFFPGGFPRR